MLAMQSAPMLRTDTKISNNSLDKQNVLIEERIPGKLPGQDKLIRYMRGKFLGKVIPHSKKILIILGRLC